MTGIIDKSSLGSVIASKMGLTEQPELFLEWVNRESTSMNDVLKWATEEDIQESLEKHNEVVKK